MKTMGNGCFRPPCPIPGPAVENAFELAAPNDSVLRVDPSRGMHDASASTMM